MSAEEPSALSVMRSRLRAGLEACAVEDLDESIQSYVRNPGVVPSELLEFVISQIEESLGEMQAALARSDVSIISGRAHALKGLGGTIGVPELSVLGASLQAAAEESATAACAAFIHHLERSVRSVPDSPA